MCPSYACKARKGRIINYYFRVGYDGKILLKTNYRQLPKAAHMTRGRLARRITVVVNHLPPFQVANRSRHTLFQSETTSAMTYKHLGEDHARSTEHSLILPTYLSLG